MELENITDESQFKDKVANLLAIRPRQLLGNLRRLITYGEDKCSRCRYIIDFLRRENKLKILYKYNNEQRAKAPHAAGFEEEDKYNKDRTVLHLAATFHKCDDLVLLIASACPRLTSAKRVGEFEGENFLHILIAKGACQTAIKFLHLKDVDQSKKRECIKAKATGPKFANTILMGETILSVAALNFDKELFKVLITFGVSVHDRNRKGETVLHTLIRYVHVNKQYLDNMLQFLDFLQILMLEPKDSPELQWGIKYTKRVWFIENYKHQTALQLAARLGEDKIFMYIMNLPWVYRVLNDYDGLFDSNKYDITEVDALAKMTWLKNKKKTDNTSMSKCSRLEQSICIKDALLILQSSPAILDTVCHLDVYAACRIMRSPALQTLLDSKWKHYQKTFIIWASLHFLVGCISLSVYAHYKIRYKNWLNDDPTSTNMIQPVNNTTEESFGNPAISQSHKHFVMIFCYLLFLPAVLGIFLEFVRTFVQRRPWSLRLVHHNGTYRLVHLLLYLCLFADSIWFLVSPSTNPNVIIVLAVLLSWCFLMFFLRPYKTFSFYTVMLQKVLIGDMIRFSVFILLELVSFTVVMQLLFLRNQPVPDEFRDFPDSMLTMFKLMLGLEDFGILSKADPEWLAILLFVTYVLITYVMLMNSLIAMMSNTCSAIQLDKTNIWQVQRLSVILFMEHLLMIFGLARTLGKRHYLLKFENKQESRYLIDVNQGPEDTVDGGFLEMSDTESTVDEGSSEVPEREDSVDGSLLEEPEETRYVIEVSDGQTPSVRAEDIARQRHYIRGES